MKVVSSPKRHTSATAKIQLRRELIAARQSPVGAVLDAYAGEGRIYEGIWREAQIYTGIDKNPRFSPTLTNHVVYKGDTVETLRQLPRTPWDVVDIDSYADPSFVLSWLARTGSIAPVCTIAITVSPLTFILGGSSAALHAPFLGIELSHPSRELWRHLGRQFVGTVWLRFLARVLKSLDHTITLSQGYRASSAIYLGVNSKKRGT